MRLSALPVGVGLDATGKTLLLTPPPAGWAAPRRGRPARRRPPGPRLPAGPRARPTPPRSRASSGSSTASFRPAWRPRSTGWPRSGSTGRPAWLPAEDLDAAPGSARARRRPPAAALGPAAAGPRPRPARARRGGPRRPLPRARQPGRRPGRRGGGRAPGARAVGKKLTIAGVDGGAAGARGAGPPRRRGRAGRRGARGMRLAALDGQLRAASRASRVARAPAASADAAAVADVGLADVDPDQRPGRGRRELGVAAHRRHRGARAELDDREPASRRRARSQSRCAAIRSAWTPGDPGAVAEHQDVRPRERPARRAGRQRRPARASCPRRRRRRRPSADTRAARSTARALQGVDRAVALGDVVRRRTRRAGTAPSTFEVNTRVGQPVRPPPQHREPGVRHGARGRARAGGRRSPRPARGRRAKCTGSASSSKRSPSRAVRRVGAPEALGAAEVGQARSRRPSRRPRRPAARPRRRAARRPGDVAGSGSVPPVRSRAVDGARPRTPAGRRPEDDRLLALAGVRRRRPARRRARLERLLVLPVRVDEVAGRPRRSGAAARSRGSPAVR